MGIKRLRVERERVLEEYLRIASEARIDCRRAANEYCKLVLDDEFNVLLVGLFRVGR